ncbi:MAG: hypothetical protein N3B11_08110 [Coriobacteriia bacterium]|nr:hypothetical protein [Coriobacteriia bacterium]
MRTTRITVLTIVFAAIPAQAFAAGAGIEGTIATGAGVLALIAAAGLLVEMLTLRKLASGAAIADNITYAVLAAMCLAASILTGWVARFLPVGVTADQARLGSDLLVLVSIVLFSVYFFRVRRAMSRFLARLSAEEADVVGALDPDGSDEAVQEGMRG